LIENGVKPSCPGPPLLIEERTMPVLVRIRGVCLYSGSAPHWPFGRSFEESKLEVMLENLPYVQEFTPQWDYWTGKMLSICCGSSLVARGAKKMECPSTAHH